MNEIFTNTICENGDGGLPGWMFCTICALPFLLVLLDILGGAK